ncbi:MAG: ribosome small subunit-dependent GTPase A [Clostridiales bacterium GWB2_37_7]|nr:MAG: ribosome small subunit-dependent GTPase A [Clostridiales bacterium GWB2_37_7]
MNLNILGWNKASENAFEKYKNQGYVAGRIFAEYKSFYKVIYEGGEILAEITGKLLYETEQQQDFPAVGDWVAITPRQNENRGTIHHVLPRKSKFSRKVAGTNTREQIVAANIDTVFIVNSMNSDFNPRRLERYLLLAWESGANPVIILSKSDLCQNIQEIQAEAEAVALGVPVHAISTYMASGMDALKQYYREGQTIALLGSSGVGKSSIINYFLGSTIQKVQELRNDGQKGKHTSTHREIFILPEGGLIIDTPGMREIQLWDAEEGLQEAFEDIDAASNNCFFRDCKHEREPGCAVIAAVKNGVIAIERLESYKKLEKELKYLEKKQSTASKLAQKKAKVQPKKANERNINLEEY